MTSADAPLISVVVPCFNTERYVAEALDSVLAQPVRGVQVIVIDDGSTDRSAEIIRAHDDRIEYRRQANGGIGAARNAGIALARGTYLTFLDADDIWTPGSLPLRLERLRGAECVYGGVEHFISPEIQGEARERLGALPATMTARFAGAMLIEKRAFDRVGPFDAGLKMGEMMDWVSRAELAGVTTVLIDDIVLRRRIHGSNTVLRLKNQKGEYLRALKGALEHKRAAASKLDDQA
ncbi:MAG TPA: glycosyltransferase family A protein [Rhizomicrobium sp.]|nr:glycosyltransferase family A protein [Rhizomicrobium sp.]